MATDYLSAASGISAIGGGLSAIEQGKTRRIISETNREMGELRAKLFRKRGAAEVAKSKSKFRQLRGKQRAALAAQGIRLDEGSAADIQAETETISELDALTIKLNTARQAFGIEQGAASEGFKGRMEERAGVSRGIETLLTGGLRTAELYQTRKKRGF